MELSTEAKDIIKKLSDTQNAEVTRQKGLLIKQANDLILSFQRDSNISTNSFSNLITNLMRVEADFAKQEGMERANQYFEQMRNCTF